jgi:hypothetical protein
MFKILLTFSELNFFCFRPEMAHKYNNPTVNTNVYLCMYNKTIDGNDFGRGYTGGACSKSVDIHGVIMGYGWTDIIVGNVSEILIFLGEFRNEYFHSFLFKNTVF